MAKLLSLLVLAIGMPLFALTSLQAASLDNFIATATYRVVNVQADDPIGLNVRDNVIEATSLSDTIVVGQIAWNARNILSSGKVVEFSGSSWRHIRFGEISGWVNERYLAEDVRRQDPSKLPEKLHCVGTEPFWSLKLGSDNSSYTGADWSDGGWVDDVKLDLLAREGILGRGDGTWAITVKQKGADNYIRALIEVANPMCDDGMSNLLFPYNMILLKGSVPHAVQGCCSIDIAK